MPRIFNHKTGKFEELNAKNKPAAAQHESVLKLAESVLFLKGDPGTGITELSQPTSDIMRIALSDGTVSDIALLQGVPGATGTGIATVSQPTPGTLEITLTDGRTKIVNLPPGLPGEPGEPGRPGEPGAAGREIELRVDSGMIQTRYAGEENWRDLLRMPRAGRGGGGAHFLRDLGDVNLSGLTKDAATGKYNLGSGGIRMPFNLWVPVVRNETIIICQKVPFDGDITEITTIATSGTCTATFYINGVALGGSANSVSSSEQSQTHSSANSFVAGDTISGIITSNSACLGMAVTVAHE
jgi:hypothetical protein